VIYAVSTNTSIGALFVRPHPGRPPHRHAVRRHWYLARNAAIRVCRSGLGERWRTFRERPVGPDARVIIIGGIPIPGIHRDRKPRDGAVYASSSPCRLPGLSLKACQVLLNSANLSAMLLYIINQACCSFLMAHENIPRRWAMDPRQRTPVPAVRHAVLLLSRATFMDPSSILIFAPISTPPPMRLPSTPCTSGY